MSILTQIGSFLRQKYETIMRSVPLLGAEGKILHTYLPTGDITDAKKVVLSHVINKYIELINNTTSSLDSRISELEGDSYIGDAVGDLYKLKADKNNLSLLQRSLSQKIEALNEGKAEKTDLDSKISELETKIPNTLSDIASLRKYVNDELNKVYQNTVSSGAFSEERELVRTLINKQVKEVSRLSHDRIGRVADSAKRVYSKQGVYTFNDAETTELVRLKIPNSGSPDYIRESFGGTVYFKRKNDSEPESIFFKINKDNHGTVIQEGPKNGPIIKFILYFNSPEELSVYVQANNDIYESIRVSFEPITPDMFLKVDFSYIGYIRSETGIFSENTLNYTYSKWLITASGVIAITKEDDTGLKAGDGTALAKQSAIDIAKSEAQSYADGVSGTAESNAIAEIDSRFTSAEAAQIKNGYSADGTKKWADESKVDEKLDGRLGGDEKASIVDQLSRLGGATSKFDERIRMVESNAGVFESRIDINGGDLNTDTYYYIVGIADHLATYRLNIDYVVGNASSDKSVHVEILIRAGISTPSAVIVAATGESGIGGIEYILFSADKSGDNLRLVISMGADWGSYTTWYMRIATQRYGTEYINGSVTTS